jgi:hypothetical protein|tara:strand:- start:1209 stop:1385 length:177 start_codon:yes stop_codon:yes gene_type:complete
MNDYWSGLVNYKNEPVTAEFVRIVEELEDVPQGKTMAEFTEEFKMPQGPAFIDGKWYC